LGFGVWGLGCGVWGVGFGVWGLGFGFGGLWWGVGVWGWGWGFRGLEWGAWRKIEWSDGCAGCLSHVGDVGGMVCSRRDLLQANPAGVRGSAVERTWNKYASKGQILALV